jgi:hypothetical protein
LCTFLQTLDEKIVPLIHDSQATFLVKENIAFFIYGAEDFGVPAYKTPSIEDVYLEKDFITVVECLEEIGGLMLVCEWREAIEWRVLDVEWCLCISGAQHLPSA